MAMKNDERDDVLYGFAVTYDGTKEFLDKYRAKFPKYAEDVEWLAEQLRLENAIAGASGQSIFTDSE